MDDETARRMDRLLAGGKLSGPEADAILDRIHATLVREQKPRPARAIRYWAGAALAAAAVLLVVFLPRGPGGQDGHLFELNPFGPDLTVRCADGTLEACPASSSLVFSLSHGPVSGFLSAYAEPLGHDGEPVFYFSKQDGSVKLATPPEGKLVSERTARIPATQAPGRYRIHVILAEHALRREELLAGSGQGRDVNVKARARVEIVFK